MLLDLHHGNRVQQGASKASPPACSYYAVEPLYKDTPHKDIFLNQDTRQGPSYIRGVYKPTPEMGNQDTLSCPKGVQNRGVSLYLSEHAQRTYT